MNDDGSIFKRFVEKSPSREIALLAFASYAEAKYDWQAHYEKQHSKQPSSSEIERWIADQSDARLGEILKAAIAYFDEAAYSYMADKIEAERVQAVNESILFTVSTLAIEVIRATSFKATFWPSVFVGVVSSFFFAVLIVVAGIVFNKDPSPFAFFRTSTAQTQATPGK